MVGGHRYGIVRKKEPKETNPVVMRATATRKAWKRRSQVKRRAHRSRCWAALRSMQRAGAATKAALAQLGMDTAIDHVTDFAQIAAYGVMSTPALVVDGKVVVYGKVLKTEEVVTSW